VPFAQYTPALVHPGFDVIEEWEFFWGLAHRMRTPLRLDSGAELDIDRKPTSDEYLDVLHASARVPLDEVRRHPGGRLFEPADPVQGLPARPERAAARMDVAPGAVVEQLRAIAAEPFSTAGGYGGDDRFSHRLISRRMYDVYNSTGDHLPRLRRRFPAKPALLPPHALGRVGVSPRGAARTDSDHDFIYGVAEASSDVRPGVISMAHARGDAPERDGELRRIGSTTGRLVSVEHDFEPLSGIPRQSAIPVNVRALTPAERASIAS